MKDLEKYLRLHRSLIIGGILFVFCFLGIVFGIIPMGQSLAELFGSVQTLQGDVGLLKAKGAQLDSLDGDQLETELTALLLAVPADKALPLLFSTLEGLGGQSGISMKSIDVAAAGPIDDSGKKQDQVERQIGSNLLPFTISIQGSLAQVRSFISSSIGVRRFLRIKSLEVTFTGSSSATAAISMDTFYAPLITSLPAIGQPLPTMSDADQNLIDTVNKLPSFPVTVLTGGAPIGKPDPFSF